MFYDRPDCIKLADEVFVFKNFLTKEEHDFYLNTFILKEAENGPGRYDDSLINWYVEKSSTHNEHIIDLWEKISELLYPEYVMHPSENVFILRPGDNGMFVHCDSPGKGCEDMLTQWDVFETCCIIDYGAVLYLGNWTGGNIFYPHINKDGSIKTNEQLNKERSSEITELTSECLEYSPSPGDLVIHSSVKPYEHGVREVESGIRYAYSNFILKAEDNPGTFYNYKTKEYFEQTRARDADSILNWLTPLFESRTVKALKKKLNIE